MNKVTSFRANEGQRYSNFLDALHQAIVVDWYMEIGCRAGRTFAPVSSKTIAVDPHFKADRNIIGAKPRLFVFQQTSDDFFASKFLKQMDIKLSFSFLDGMHLFEYLLRDFFNTEANSDPNGVIALHDCVPFNEEMLTRDLENLPRGPWTGDVWKLIPILRKYRPDLNLTVLPCNPTGLVLISNLDPGNKDLKKNYDKILADWMAMDLTSYGLDRFYACFDPVDPDVFVAEGYKVFDKVRRDAGDQR
jgi:hypothetical protein